MRINDRIVDNYLFLLAPLPEQHRIVSVIEQQLLMVLGLLRFTKEDEALFLLDEPDTHLNPNWSVQYLEFMHRVVGDQPTSQVIMSTHNPLVIVGIAASIVEDLQNALEQFMAIAEDLGGKTNSNSGPLFL